MSIGIGVTTYQRPTHYQNWLKQVNKFRPESSEIFIYEDKEKKGIAYGKNECLKVLKENDYIFLFDDDCFPIRDGWQELFITCYVKSGQHHLLYLKETPTIRKIEQYREVQELVPIGHEARMVKLLPPYWINSFDNCGGCFMFLTKEVIKKVGGYCTDYGRYGYEHAGYTSRIHAAGLTPMGKYLCPQGAGEYIYAMDYDNYLWFNKEVNHQPSIMDEINMLPSWLAENKKVYERDIQTIYQAL